MRYTFTTGIGDYGDWHVLARTAEEVGFHAFSIPDSTMYPEHTESDYPYNDTDVIRAYAAATPFIEPMIAFTWMAAVTERLRFFPNVMKVPIRSPIILAKQIGSLAALSGNRITLGAGIGPWAEDYSFNNLDWSRRGQLLDDCITIIQGFLSGEFFEFHSENFDIARTRMSPAPTAAVPIIIGGHSAPALRRAARLGDGWVSVHGSLVVLEGMIKKLDALRSEYGTSGRPFEIHAGEFDFQPTGGGERTPEHYKRLEAIGVTDACVVLHQDPTATLDQKIDLMRRFGDEVISRT